MTADAFRSSAVRVAAMRELFNNPTLAEAIVTLKDESPVVDALDNHPEVTSVRLLSRAYGHGNAIALLLSLAEPLPPQEPDEQQTWGVDPKKLNP